MEFDRHASKRRVSDQGTSGTSAVELEENQERGDEQQQQQVEQQDENQQQVVEGNEPQQPQVQENVAPEYEPQTPEQIAAIVE